MPDGENISDFGWLLPNLPANMFDMLNPMNWFTKDTPAVASTSENLADTEAACQVLGVEPDFFSPVGSRLSEHSGTDSESGASGRDSAIPAIPSGAASDSSRTSDFSDGSYESSSDSGSGSSVPDQKRDYGALSQWESQFLAQMGDSSDVVDDNPEANDDYFN